MKQPQIGEKYTMRKYPHLGDSELQTVKVTKITELGDGTVIVSYRHNWPFRFTEDVELSFFMANAAVHKGGKSSE